METDGQIKPWARLGVVPDMHTHSEFSHDSKCPIEETSARAAEKSMGIVFVTDHCDIVGGAKPPMPITVLKAVRTAVEEGMEKVNAQYENVLSVLCGIEPGECFWDPERAAAMLENVDCRKYETVIRKILQTVIKKRSRWRSTHPALAELTMPLCRRNGLFLFTVNRAVISSPAVGMRMSASVWDGSLIGCVKCSNGRAFDMFAILRIGQFINAH